MFRLSVPLAMAVVLMGCSDKKPMQGGAPSTNSSSATVPNQAPTPAINLVGTEWRLEDLGGAGIIDNSQATLVFPEAGRVAGNGSCNRFTGSLTLSGETMKISPLASTRMACAAEAVSNQEMKYLKALEGAMRYEWKDPYLLIYSEGMEKPLRFEKAK
jgi:heat shock protein HslJ